MRYIYTESIVRRLPKPAERVAWFMLAAAFGFSALSVYIFGIPSIIGAVVLGILFYRVHRRVDSEYEYVHTNDEFDIHLVFRGANRKELMSIRLENVVVLAPSDSRELDRFPNLKIRDFSGNHKKGSHYTMVYSDNGEKKAIGLLLDDNMRSSLKQWVPGKVKL